MGPRYEIGQRVVVKPVSEPDMSLRKSNMDPIAGQSGEVADYHWISPPGGEVFYIYEVRISNGHKEVVLYEDEIEADRG